MSCFLIIKMDAKSKGCIQQCLVIKQGNKNQSCPGFPFFNPSIARQPHPWEISSLRHGWVHLNDALTAGKGTTTSCCSNIRFMSITKELDGANPRIPVKTKIIIPMHILSSQSHLILRTVILILMPRN
jgi:hypothetical protein